MDVNSREPSQNIIPFRIKGTEVARFDICGNLGIGTSAPSAILDVVGNVKINGELYVNGTPLTSLTSGVVVNMDSQPVAATALNRQKKQSIPLTAGSTLATSDVIAKMSGVSVGKTQTYGVGPAQMASYGNIVVAVGEGTNSIAYSLTNPPTAASWVGIPNSANTFTTRGWNIAYANGTWVAAGEGTNAIAYSTMTPPVASSWVGIPHGTPINGVVNTFSSAGSGRDIVYANGAWVAVGLGTNSIAYSLANPPTAESWVGITLSFSPTLFGTNVGGITFGNGTWVAVGEGTNGIAYSTRTPPTAESWVAIPLSSTNDAGVNNIPTTRGYNVAFANGVWLAAGQGTNTLCYSVENPPIAGSWMPITNSLLFGTVGRSLAYGNGTWVACGESVSLLAYSTSRIPHSSSWVAMKGPTPSSSGQEINHVSFNASTNTWYFLGDIGTNCMFYSTATPPVPATWIGVPRSASTFTTQAFGAAGITTNAFTSPVNVARLDNKVTFPANRMLAVGGGGGGVGGTDVLARSSLTPSPAATGTISYSDDDGATWTMVPGGATNAMFSSAADIAANASFGVGGSRGANAVAWNGEKWVAAGNGRTNSLAFSDDGGMTWNGITGKSIFSVEARDVAWNGRMWVAVGRGVNFSTAYSYDGVTWMGPVTDDVSGIPMNVFSYDIAGPTVTASMSDISGGGNHVIWTGKMWVATGTRTLIAGSSPAAYYTVAYSVNGKSWTGVPESGATSTGFDMYAHGIAWNGRNFVATGRGTVNTLAFSTDATATASWQGLGNSVFSIWGRGITWGARRWMATGRGTNTVAYSTNGRNWQGCGANVFKPMRRFMAMGDTGLYTTVSNGQPQRGVAFSYSDDGVTWDAPVVNQSLEFSTPLGGTSDATRSAVFTNNILLTNAITDIASAHTGLMFSADGGVSWARVPGSSDTEANGGTGMTVANGGSYSLAMNTTRTRFLAGGGDAASATRKVYFSNDGFNWRNGVSSPNTSQMAWVHSSLWVGGGYNRWLVGGSDATTNANGRIMYSGDADAIAAWLPVSPATYTATVVCCFAANTDFSVILAGALSGNVIYRSVNGGANWTTVDISGTPTGGVRSIAFSPALGRWVAVGGGGGAANTIIYSTDATGSVWIAPPQGAKTAATAIFKNGSEATRVIWDALGARFLVGGWNGAASTAAMTNVFGLDATANNNPGYTMAYSADGVNWTPVTVRSSDDVGAGAGASVFGPFLTRCREIMALDISGDFTPINTGYSVSWNSYANRFVATGNGTTPVVYSSDGGVTWTPANQQPPQQAVVVAGGASGTMGSTTTVSPITYTIDGKTWSQGLGAKEAFGSSGTVMAVRYGQTSTAISPNGRIWVAGGTGTSSIAFSQNGIRWTPVANATTMITNVRAIVYAAPAAEQTSTTPATSGVGNGVWVAGGDISNSLVFSYDGISWSEVPNSLAILSRCNAIAYGSGVFVAGGLAGTLDPTANMAYSTDGYNWQPIRGSGARISSSGASINCITYGRDENGRGLWVAGAFGSSTVSILYSYNGIDWVGVVGSGGSLSSTVTGLAYGVNSTTGRGLWVASVYRGTSAGYSFLFSTNGRDGWTPVPNTKAGLFEVNTSGATSVAYLNGVWYATGLSAGVSTGRTLAYSYEGSSGWFGVYPTTNLYGVAVTTYSATSMLCVATTGEYAGAGAGAGALTPIRGLGWTAGVGSAYLQHPTIVFGASGAQQAAATAAMSTDGGRSWGASTLSIATSAFRGGVCNDALWNGIVWAAVGYDAVSGAKVATSKDGVTWTQIPAGSVPIAGVLYSIMWNGSVWMAGGDGSPTNDLNTNSIAWSPDLAAWTGISNTDTKLRVVKRIAWNGMYWVAVGSGDVSTIMHSRDKLGLVWEDTYMSGVSVNKTAVAMSAGNDVVWGGGRWVAVGRPNNSEGNNAASILYSVDTDADYAINGRRWTAVAGSAQLFPYGANSVSWNGKRFIATGPASCAASTGNIIAWSADGMSWTAYSTAKTVAPGQRWVAVGSGSRACIALSADGQVWTDVSGSAVLFPDISGASSALVSTMKTGGRAIGWNGSSLVAGGARAATTVTASTTTTAATMATTGRTTIPVCAFIGSGNGVMGGGTTNAPMDATAAGILRTSSSVFITHMDVNMRESSAPWANMWLNTYTDLSGTQLFQVTPETQTFSSALKWNGWSWVANFGMTTFHPQTGEQYGAIWYCSDPLARVGWSVASNSIAPRILIGQGGYAALEWNGVAWLACGYDPNNNNMIYTTDKYGATGWTAVSGTVSGAGSASFQPVCIASSSRFWVVGGSQGAGESAIYYTSDRTGATGWRAVTTTGVGASVLPAIRITSMGYNGTVWICCGGGRVGTDISGGSISWRADLTGANAAEDFATGWTAATVSGTSGGIPPIMSASSAIATNAGAGVTAPIWVVVGEDLSGNGGGQIAYTTDITGSSGWKKPATGTLPFTTFGRLNGIAWTGYSWIATSGAGFSRLASTTDPTAATQWNNTTNGIYTPTLCTNAVAFVNIPISLLTTGMPSSAGAGAGTGAMWRAGAGRAQGLLPGGGSETTSVVVRSSNGAEGTRWSQTYARNFLIAVGGSVIRDASGGGGTNRMAYSYDGGLSWTTNNTAVLTSDASNVISTIRTVKYGNGMWVAGGDSAGSSVSGNNCLAWSRDGVNWTGAGGTQIFGSAGACYAVCCNDRGRWVAVGGAPLGTVGTYTNTSGSIYTMAWSDDGMNWTPVIGSRALFGIVCQGVTYGADASGVGMWTAIGRGGAYTGCAYSYDGKTWYLSQTSGSLFGTGVNVLTERYAPVAANWRTVAINSTGQIQFAGANGGLVYRSMDYGVTWSALTLPSRAWVSVAVSSTGQYVVAASSDGTVVRLYNSSDYGATWVARGYGSNTWVQVAISATGQYQVGVANNLNIQISRDYGVTWMVPTSGGTSTSILTGVAISSSGQYITFVCNGFDVQQSSDYGVTFTSRSSSYQWSCVAMSSTGQIQIGGFNGNNMYVSINYGVDWLVSNAPLPSPSARYRFVAISSTGQYRSGVTENTSETIKRSNNYDAGWTAVGVAGNYFAIAMSSTGQYQTAVSQTASGFIFISSNFGETWSAAATDSRSLGITYGKDASGAGMWVATAGRRDRDISANVANTMAYSYDGKLWRGIRASVGLSEQAWSVAYGKDGFGVGMWVAAGYDTTCGLKWSYDGVTWNATMGASGAAVWTGMAAGRRALAVYWNGSMWLASTSDTRNGEPRGTSMAANNASSVPGYLLYSYNGKNWLPVLAPNTYGVSITGTAQASVYSVLPNPAILDFGSFYDDQSQRGVTIANTTARTVGAVMSGGVPIENVNTIVPYGRGSLTTGQVPFLMGGDSGLVDTVIAGSSVTSGLPITSELAASTTSLSTSTDGGITWRAVPNSTRVMTKVNKILCDETTQQIVAVGTGNYSVATSTPATAGSADGWTGVFGSRMTDTRAGLFEKYGTGASWFGGAKMWIASGRAQTRRGSSLAVSVNGTVWQDAKIVSQTAAGTSLGGRGSGLTSRTTTGGVTIDTTDRTTLYTFTAFTFDNAGATGRTGPDLSACRTRYATTAPTATWAQDTTNKYLDMSTNGIQLWTVPATGSYTIRAVGAAGGTIGTFGRGRDIQTSTVLTKGEVIKILVGQKGTYNSNGSGGGGTFVVRGIQTPIIVAGGGGGRGGNPALEYINSNASSATSGNKGGDGSGTNNGAGGIDGAGGSAAAIYAAGGGGLLGAGGDSSLSIGGASFISGGIGGSQGNPAGGNGGFGGGGGSDNGGGGGGGGGYSGGGGGRDPNWPSGGGGGSFAISTMTDAGAINTGQGSVTITFNNFIITNSAITPLTFNSSVIPYTSAATPLLTYTDSAAAFSTQVGSVAVNSQYNRAVVGGSGVQFVAGGRGGIAVSNDGQNWTAAAAGATTVFQTPTNTTTRTGSGGFDASFGTVALTQRLTTPATYPSGDLTSVSLSKTGQYQTAVVSSGNIWTSSDYGVTWTERTTGATRAWRAVSLSSTGQYQTAVIDPGNIWTSSDFGVTWTSRATSLISTWVSLSSTGQYQSVSTWNGNIWTSSDYGANWTSRATSLSWSSVSLSSTGQYQTGLVSGGNIWISSDFGVSWSERSTGAVRSWRVVSLSSTGQYQTATIVLGNIWTSSDYGINWTERSTGSTRDWRVVSLSSTGQYQTAVVYSGNIWTSSDFGVTWTARTEPGSRTWRSVSISSTGQYQTAVVDTSGHIWTSTDFGVTWVQRSTATRTNAFTRIKSSASGQYQLATSGPVGNTNGQLYVSSDYGQTWIPRRGLGTWLGGAVSATGAIMTAFLTPTAATAVILRSTDYGASFAEIPATTLTGIPGYWRAIAATNSAATQTALAHGSTIYRSTDYGSTWNSTATVDVVGILTTEFSSVASPTYAWKSIAMSSADAKIQTGVVSGGQIYVNSNYGREAWTAVDSARNWTAVAMSADGRYQSAVVSSGAIYYNSTSGTGTWTAVSSPAPGFAWTGIAVSSADGKYQTAVASGATNIYVNSNFGVGTWTAKESARNWFGVAMSATGQYQTAINRGGFIYIDASFGAAASWTQVDSQRDWASVAMSSTGQYQTAVVAGGKIYVNSNYGAHGAWTETESNRAWISVAVSGATGRYQTAVAQNAQIYINANFGAGAWSAVDSSRNWVSVTVSSDGKYQSAAVATSGQVYFSRDYGATWSTTAGLDIMGNRWQDVAVSAETGAVQVTCVSGGYLYVSSDGMGANWVSTPVSIDGVVPQATNRVWQAVAVSANGQYGLACVNNGYLYRSVNSGATWVSSDINIDNNGIQASPRWWQDVGISANGKYQVACSLNSGNIFYSKNYGASWTSLTAAGSRAWSSVALSENGGTISATTNDATGGVWVYSMPDDQYYRAAVVANSGSTTTPATVRAIAYGNSGVGAAVDGYWVAGADASANSLAYSSNGVDWTAVAGSKTTLFNTVNGVAYGADTSGTPLWVAVGLPFVGSVPGSTAYSIAYSYNMTQWTGVRNAANFTGQGNHVAYGQDEFGAGVWVAVGQGDGVLSANLGDSALYSSNGTPGATVFYSYDGANWAAGTGAGVFAVSGTDIAWGVDASGVGMWVATGIGFTDPTTGVVVPGGQVAHSTNGRVWTPIRTSAPITPAMTPVTLTTRGSAIPLPPASSGVVAPVYGSAWSQLGQTILGDGTAEQSGYSVSLSADGMTIAVGAWANSSNKGVTRVYKYDPMTLTWPQLGPNILGDGTAERSGWSVSLSADGNTVAVGAYANNNFKGVTRVYKYNATTITWPQSGQNILDATDDYSGASVSLSADGMTIAVGAWATNSNKGVTRIYKYNGSTWALFGPTIPGVDASEQSGFSVSLSADGTSVAVGAWGNSSNKGVTRVYRYNASTNTWPLLGPTISGVDATERAGYSVSISADGTAVAIGAFNNNSTRGVTRVYTYNASTAQWPQLGTNILGDGTVEQSGISVSISADGMTVAIGAPSNNNGIGVNRVYKYNASTNTWPQLGPTISGVGASENSGFSVSLSADGTTIAVGAPFNNGNKGVTRIYKIPVYATPTYSTSNPAIADIYANAILFIKDGASGTTTITATQPATPPFTFAPATVQGTLDVSGTTYTLTYHTFYPIFTPFPGAFAGDTPCVAYGRAGSQGAGAPRWMVGGAGGTNVFAMSSAPTTIGAWSVVGSFAPTANAPFPTCNSLAYSNGVWVASNNTDDANIIARSTDGGSTWTPVTASSVSGIIAGAAALGANAFCNYSLAYADFSNDTNLRSWVAVQGTKNFFFEGGVSAVATVTPDVSAAVYNAVGGRAWWVAGGVGLAGVASIGSTADPSGATGWTKATSPAIANLATVNAIAFSPFTQRWLAVGVGATGSLGTNILYSDASGTGWTAGAVTSALTPVITLNTCVWNQAPASASSAGRWLAAGTRDGGVGADSASLYISTDASGAATPWTPIVGTGAILSQVYSLAFNGNVWIAAGAPATDNGSTSTLMRTTTDPTGATGWQGIPVTNISTSGFDTAARSVTWNADQQMWVATGENTGSAADASFSSVIYSRDVNGAPGTWRTVRESNSVCFSGEGTGVAFTGDKWFAVGDNGSGSGSVIVATTGLNAANAGATTTTWTPVTHGTALTRASDIAYTGRRLVASGASASGATSGIIYSSNGTGDNGTWTSVPNVSAGAFNDASGGASSITFEASYEGTGRLVATGRSATNALSVSTDGGVSWTVPSVQYTSSNTFDTTTTPLFTTGGNSVAYVGNDTLFAGGGNDVHWNGKRWVATGRNSVAAASFTVTPGTAPPDVVNNNTAPVATSEDGITWQCVRASQAPTPLTEGTFIGTNSRIGATPLINSQIVITDGGDTESAMDYGGGSGTGVSQIDIIAELTPVSNAAGSVVGTVGILGAAGNGGVNGVGHATTPSFDNTAFTITTRPM